MNKLLQPIWFRLPKRFYQTLETLSEAVGAEPEDVLELAVRLLGRYAVTAEQNQAGTKEFADKIWALLGLLQKHAKAHEVKVVDALADAIKLYGIYGPLSAVMPAHGDVSEARRTPSALVTLYWAKIPPEERSRRARELARKRWDAQKLPRPKASGE